MFQRQRLSVLPFCLAAVVSAGLALTLTGCGMAGGSAVGKSAATVVPAVSQFGGNVHGGQQPVTGATVTLWAAGVTGASPAGYGANSTSIATTTTDSNGNFSFNNTSGVSPCTTGQYLYITSTGGNSGSGTNAQLALMSAIPTPCNSATGAQFVNVNELTTVATVTALQQFMSITPGGATPWKIGAPVSNTVGLANAFLMVGNLVNVATGATATSNVSNAVSNTVGGLLYTTIVNPDYTKINTLGDILAYCVNSAGGTNCNSLFSDTTPSGGTSPTDTIQAMYDLATNAAGLNLPNHGNTQGSPYYLCSTYVSASAPFQPTLPCTTTAYPADWAIGVSFRATNPSAATVGTVLAGSIAIDASGNIWTATYGSAAGSAGAVTEFNVNGQVILGPVTSGTVATTGGWYNAQYLAQGGASTYAIGGSKPHSIAIDTNGNAWAASYWATATTVTANTTGGSTGTSESPLFEVSPSTGTATAYLVGSQSNAIAIDGSNNIYFSNNPNAPTSNRYYFSELAANGTYYTGVGRVTSYYSQAVIDQSSSNYASAFYPSCNATIQRTNTANELANATTYTAPVSASPVTLSTTSTPTTCVLAGAVDAKNNFWGVTTTYLEYIDLLNGTPAAPLVTSFASGTGTTQGGLDSAQSVTIDGTGNLWVGNKPTSTTGGISAFTPTTTGTSTTITPKSPAGTNVFGFGSSYGYQTVSGTVIDPSGNVWIETTGGSYLNFLVGIASPVVTPISVAIKNSALGVRP